MSQPISGSLKHDGANIAFTFNESSGDDLIVLVPGMGRGIEDYRVVENKLVNAGISVLAVNLRGIGNSSGSLQGKNLYTLAEDILAVLLPHAVRRIHLVGYNLSNRIVRCAATLCAKKNVNVDRPKLTSLVLLGAGGRVDPRPEAANFGRYFMESLIGVREANKSQQLDWFHSAYMAKKSEVKEEYLQDWWPEVAFQQHAALQQTPMDWWLGGGLPILVIQGSEDKLAPTKNGYLLQQEGGAVEVLDINNAGHLFLFEQPILVAEQIIEFVAKFSN